MLVRLVGRSAPNYFKRCLSGDHAVAPETVDRLSDLLGADRWRREYLRLLAQIQTSSGAVAKEDLVNKLEIIRARVRATTVVESAIEREPQFSLVLSEIASRSPATESQIIEAFHGRFAPSQITDAIAFLKQLGAISVTQFGYTAGCLVVPSNSGAGLMAMATQEYFLFSAIHALRERRREVHCAGVTLSLSERKLQKVVLLWREFFDEIVTVALEEDNGEHRPVRVQLSIQTFK